MDNTSIQRIQESLQSSKAIAVAVGSNPSIDEMAAVLSLYLSLQEMGKAVAVVSASEPIVELSNLVGIDKVKTQYESEGADLVVSFPYREGEIEKVSYTIENGFLNIVVKAGEQGLTFSEQEVKYTRGSAGGQLDLLFVVGTPRLSDIQGQFGPDMLKNVTVVNIDNKQENQGFGDIVLISPRFSSVSEQMTQLLSDLRFPVNTDIAQNLLDGIMYATDNFQSPQTSYLAFEMGGILMRQGAIRTRGSQQITRPQQQPYGGYNQTQLPAQQPQQQRRPQQGQDKRQQFDQRRQQPRQQQQRGQNYQQRPNQSSYPTQHQVQQPQHSRQQPSQVPQQQQQQQSQQQQQPQQQDNAADLNPPTDWLTPKVYKGSSNV